MTSGTTGRRLVLIRHAKAETHDVADIERALAARGLRDAAAVGRWLLAQGIAPDYAAVSPARRTRQTWALIAAELGAAPEPTLEQRIYENSVDDLLAVISEVPAEVATLTVVGHNPSMHELALTLDDGGGEREASRFIRDEFPTSAVAVLDVVEEWQDLSARSGRLVLATAPRG